MIRVEDLRQTADLLTLAGRDTHLRRVGASWYAGPCPFCGGRDRFVLKNTPDGWRWLCRHCTDGKYLDAIDYIQRREGVDFKEAIRRLDGGFSPLRDDDLPPFVQPKPKQPEQQDEQTTEHLFKVTLEAVERLHNPHSPLAALVRAYLDRRGILSQTRERALLGAAEVYDPKAGRKRPALAIPYLNSKLVVRGVKYRFCDSAENGLRYIAEKGSANGFYYLPDAIGRSDRLLVVEGEINLLSLVQVGPEVDLLSTGSQSLSGGMKQTLARLVGKYRKVWVWMDEPKAAAEVAALIRGTPIRSPQVDGEKLDANRMLVEGLLHEFVNRLIGGER